jgi:hypothetical protein
VLAADACYFCRTRMRDVCRAIDREAMMESLDRLQALETAGARIFFRHDAEFWQAVPQGPWQSVEAGRHHQAPNAPKREREMNARGPVCKFAMCEILGVMHMVKRAHRPTMFSPAICS